MIQLTVLENPDPRPTDLRLNMLHEDILLSQRGGQSIVSHSCGPAC